MANNSGQLSLWGQMIRERELLSLVEDLRREALAAGQSATEESLRRKAESIRRGLAALGNSGGHR